jgi:hypothetical protein
MATYDWRHDMNDTKHDKEFRSFESYKDEFFKKRSRNEIFSSADPEVTGASLVKESLKKIEEPPLEEEEAEAQDDSCVLSCSCT